MKLLLIRHAIAVEREAFEGDDGKRPLTREGIGRMRRAARGLARLVPAIDVLASSPLERASHTARIVGGVYGIPSVVETATLAPDAAPAKFLDWLKRLQAGDEALIACVGHEPDLGRLATWLLSGGPRGFLPMKKGGAALLDFSGTPKAGGATLRWERGGLWAQAGYAVQRNVSSLEMYDYARGVATVGLGGDL